MTRDDQVRALTQALGCVYTGATRHEADALHDQLDDMGLELVRRRPRVKLAFQPSNATGSP